MAPAKCECVCRGRCVRLKCVCSHTCERTAEWTAWFGQCCCCRCLHWADSRGPGPPTPANPVSWCCSAYLCLGSESEAGLAAVWSGWLKWGCPGSCGRVGPARPRSHWPDPDNSCSSPGRWASGTPHLTSLRGWQVKLRDKVQAVSSPIALSKHQTRTCVWVWDSRSKLLRSSLPKWSPAVSQVPQKRLRELILLDCACESVHMQPLLL